MPMLGEARFRWKGLPFQGRSRNKKFNDFSGSAPFGVSTRVADILAEKIPYVSNSETIPSGVTARYASALFDLALSEKKIPAVEKDLKRFDDLLAGSDDLRRLVVSPVFSSDDQYKAIDALLKKAKITGLVGNFVRVVARNRRLFAMQGMLGAYRRLVAEHKGEITADVTVAKALSAPQSKELKGALKGVVGKDVAINATVDPSILGGMIVKVGSRQIDTSLKTRLSSLKLALKEVG